jgi:hypothetical protein
MKVVIILAVSSPKKRSILYKYEREKSYAPSNCLSPFVGMDGMLGLGLTSCLTFTFPIFAVVGLAFICIFFYSIVA